MTGNQFLFKLYQTACEQRRTHFLDLHLNKNVRCGIKVVKKEEILEQSRKNFQKKIFSLHLTKLKLNNIIYPQLPTAMKAVI